MPLRAASPAGQNPPRASAALGIPTQTLLDAEQGSCISSTPGAPFSPAPCLLVLTPLFWEMLPPSHF